MTPIAQKRIRYAKSKLDLTIPGALEELQALLANPASGVEEYEALAAKFPLKLAGMHPANQETTNKALAKIRTSFAKSSLAIKTGKDIGYSRQPRLTTGWLGLDYALNGGIPRGYIGQFKGAESNGKTFTAMKAVADVIRVGGHAVWVAAERFDKPWARTCGIPIPYSEEELLMLPQDAREEALDYNDSHPEGENFILIAGKYGNELLQSVVDLVYANVIDLIVVDSIAVMRRASVLDKKSVGDDTMAGEAKMINDFCARCENAMNAVESRAGRVLDEAYKCVKCGAVVKAKKDHKKCPDGAKPEFESASLVGEPVRSAIIVINQIRDRGIGSPYAQKPDATGGRGLKHTKGYDVNFVKGTPLEADLGNGLSCPYGKRIVVEIDKSKIGPPHRQAVGEIQFFTVPGISEAGEFNPVVDLIGFKDGDDPRVGGLADAAGLITVENNTVYTLFDKSYRGFANLQRELEKPENFSIVNMLRVCVKQWIDEQANA